MFQCRARYSLVSLTRCHVTATGPESSPVFYALLANQLLCLKLMLSCLRWPGPKLPSVQEGERDWWSRPTYRLDVLIVRERLTTFQGLRACNLQLHLTSQSSEATTIQLQGESQVPVCNASGMPWHAMALRHGLGKGYSLYRIRSLNPYRLVLAGLLL